MARPDLPVTAIKSVAPGSAASGPSKPSRSSPRAVSAPPDALETMLRLLGRAPETVPVEQLGRQWTLGRNLIKRYPAQYLTQGAIQAALELYAGGVRAGLIEEVTVYGHAGVCGSVQGSPHAYQPASHADADHSTPFVVAMALLQGRLTPADYHGEPWLRPDVRALMARVRLVEEPARQRAYVEQRILGCRVVVRLRDGSTRAAEVVQPRGHPDAPLDDDGLVAKLDDLLAGGLGPAGGQRLLAACDGLPAAPDLRGLLDLLRARPPRRDRGAAPGRGVSARHSASARPGQPATRDGGIRGSTGGGCGRGCPRTIRRASTASRIAGAKTSR